MKTPITPLLPADATPDDVARLHSDDEFTVARRAKWRADLAREFGGHMDPEVAAEWDRQLRVVYGLTPPRKKD